MPASSSVGVLTAQTSPISAAMDERLSPAFFPLPSDHLGFLLRPIANDNVHVHGLRSQTAIRFIRILGDGHMYPIRFSCPSIDSSHMIGELVPRSVSKCRAGFRNTCKRCRFASLDIELDLLPLFTYHRHLEFYYRSILLAHRFLTALTAQERNSRRLTPHSTRVVIGAQAPACGPQER